MNGRAEAEIEIKVNDTDKDRGRGRSSSRSRSRRDKVEHKRVEFGSYREMRQVTCYSTI